MGTRIPVIFFLCLAVLLGSCQKKEVKQGPKNTFESLMGEDLPAWKYVQTQEDFENLAFFKSVYEQNIAQLKKEGANRTPQTIHFIWLGPKPFPRESIENVRTWIAQHPNWKVKFWTDRARPLPHPKMELKLLQDFTFRSLEKEFHSSDNFGEKSDVLRYELLFQEGGVYVDHDVVCYQPFDPLCQSYDFFCGLEAPYPTALSSSVLPTNNIVGARAGHPLLAEILGWLSDNWESIERDYPGKDRDAVINRVSHRTFVVLGEMFKKHGNKEGYCDIALPTYYFNSPKAEDALFAQHQYRGTWFENESDFEKMARKRLMMLSKKVNKILLGLGVLFGLNLLGFGALFFLFRRQRAELR